MGIFTSTRSLKSASSELIKERAEEHVSWAKNNGFDFSDCGSQEEMEEIVCDDILLELLSRGATTGYETNYSYEEVETNVLNEI